MASTSLSGKVAFITGSTEGIGWATADLFAAQGAAIALNGHANPERLQERAAELRRTYNTECLELPADVSQPEQVEHCYREIFRRFKRLDVLVNNAGTMEASMLGMIDPHSMQRVFQTNTFGAVHNLQRAARLMGRHGSGSIVNVVSILATNGSEGQALYSASKAALLGLTLSAAKELAPQNIRVNAVAPGFIKTRMLEQDMTESKKSARLASIRMGRFGEAAEVAAAILFFASDLSGYVTGQVLGVDGGAIV
jgi:3-oxoacyl-[acyl-carrier protein] reductase